MSFEAIIKNLDLKTLTDLQSTISESITSIKNTEPEALRKLSCQELKNFFDKEKNPERIKKIQTEIDYRKEGQLKMVKDFNSDGSFEELWTTNNKLCRKDGPRKIFRRKDGTLTSEKWAISELNDFNRLAKDGPTIIHYDEKERIISKEYREGIKFVKEKKYTYAS